MKAKVLKTGEVVEVQLRANGRWASSNMNTTKFFNESELDFEFQEWDAFRREAAKDILCAMLSTKSEADPKDVTMAIEIADELIKQLRDGKVYQTTEE